MIRLSGLRKHYRVHKRPPGLKAALKSLFKREYEIVKAVDGIDFSISAGLHGTAKCPGYCCALHW